MPALPDTAALGTLFFPPLLMVCAVAAFRPSRSSRELPCCESVVVNEFLTKSGRVLIIRTAIGREYSTKKEKNMIDLIYVGVVVLFFVIGGLYVGVCEKL